MESGEGVEASPGSRGCPVMGAAGERRRAPECPLPPVLDSALLGVAWLQRTATCSLAPLPASLILEGAERAGLRPSWLRQGFRSPSMGNGNRGEAGRREARNLELTV